MLYLVLVVNRLRRQEVVEVRFEFELPNDTWNDSGNWTFNWTDGMNGSHWTPGFNWSHSDNTSGWAANWSDDDYDSDDYDTDDNYD